MSKTRHLQTRMSQRGIKKELIDLALSFGELDGDRFVLGKRSLKQLLEELRDLERQTKQALDKGGVVVVEAGGKLITTYRAEGRFEAAHTGAR